MYHSGHCVASNRCLQQIHQPMKHSAVLWGKMWIRSAVVETVRVVTEVVVGTAAA